MRCHKLSYNPLTSYMANPLIKMPKLVFNLFCLEILEAPNLVIVLIEWNEGIYPATFYVSKTIFHFKSYVLQSLSLSPCVRVCVCVCVCVRASVAKVSVKM